MPKENLGLLNGHNTLQSQQNILLLVELSVIDITGEGFVVSNYQPSIHINTKFLLNNRVRTETMKSEKKIKYGVKSIH